MMENQELTWQDVPRGYALCIHSDCPQAATCLRAIAFSLLPATERRLSMANPKRCTQSADCPEYKDAQPLRYALGFSRLQQELLPRQYDQLRKQLQRQFGRNEYFRRRRGERPMPPSEQELVRQLLSDIGAPEGLDFDAYEERIAWND